MRRPCGSQWARLGMARGGGCAWFRNPSRVLAHKGYTCAISSKGTGASNGGELAGGRRGDFLPSLKVPESPQSWRLAHRGQREVVLLLSPGRSASFPEGQGCGRGARTGRDALSHPVRRQATLEASSRGPARTSWGSSLAKTDHWGGAPQCRGWLHRDPQSQGT